MMLPTYARTAAVNIAADDTYSTEAIKMAAASTTDPMIKEALALAGTLRTAGKVGLRALSAPAQVVVDTASRMHEKAKSTLSSSVSNFMPGGDSFGG